MAPDWHLLNRPEAVHGLEQRQCQHSEARDRYIANCALPTRMPDLYDCQKEEICQILYLKKCKER
jgi:hypothetical protein